MKPHHFLPIFLALFFGAQSAQALQIVDPVEGHNAVVRISEKETTLLRIENAKIRGMVFTEGELIVDKNEAAGTAYIRPGVLTKPINLRIESSSGALHNLILQVTDIPQEDVVIREPAKESQALPAGSSYANQIKALVVAMADPGNTKFAPQRKNQPVALWEGTGFVLVATYKNRMMVGEHYELTNTGKSQLRMVEQEFYRRGVLAVAIEKMILEPGEQTRVFVVRGGL